MSLNSDNLDELKGLTIVDNNGPVVPPSDVPKITDGPTVTIIAENQETYGKRPTLTEEQEKELPMLDVQFKLINNHIEKLVDMESVESTILGDDKIDQSKADQVDAVFEGLYNTSLQRGYFTQLPTKINLSRVKDHMKKGIAKEEMKLIGTFETMITSTLDSATSILGDLKSNHIPELLVTGASNRSDAFTMAEKIASSENMVIPYNGGFQNLSKVDLSSIPEVPYNVNGKERFDRLVRGTKELFEDKKFKATVLSRCFNDDLDDSGQHEKVLEYGNKAIDIFDIILFYKETDTASQFSVLLKKTVEAIETLERIRSEAEPLMEKRELVRQYLADNADTLVEISQYHTNIVKQVFNMKYLNFLTFELFDFYRNQ